MAIKVIYENDYQGVLLTAESDFNGGDLYRVSQQIYQHEFIHLLRYQIVDFTQVDSVDIDIETVQKIADLDRAAAEKNKGMKVAIIAEDNLLKYLSEAWEIFSENPWLETKICSTMGDAREWLIKSELNRENKKKNIQLEKKD
ncbi:hypothetical protein [Aurantivibrio infirmus]